MSDDIKQIERGLIQIQQEIIASQFELLRLRDERIAELEDGGEWWRTGGPPPWERKTM